MKIVKELRALSPAELSTRLRESKKELLKLYGTAATGAAVGKIKKNKKNIARILTLLHEKGGL